MASRLITHRLLKGTDVDGVNRFQLLGLEWLTQISSDSERRGLDKHVSKSCIERREIENSLINTAIKIFRCALV